MNFLPFCVWDNAALLSRAQKSAIQDPETTARGGRRGRENRHPNIPPSRPRAMSSIIVFSVVRALFFSRHHAQTPRRRWMISHPSSQSTASFREERDIHSKQKTTAVKAYASSFLGEEYKDVRQKKERERERERTKTERSAKLVVVVVAHHDDIWFYNKKVCVFCVVPKKKSTSSD